MTPEQLLEATTKALFRTCAFATCDFEHADEDIQESYRVHARAALAVAIEAVSAEIDEQIEFEKKLDGVPREQIQLVVSGMKQLKRAILALIPKEPT